MDREQMNALLGMTEAEMDASAKAYEMDAWDERMLGKPTAGRPALFGTVMGTVSFKEEKPKIARIDARAASLGLSRSDYLRKLIDRDLAAIPA